MKPVLIRPSADADLDGIFAWIARDDPEAAERLVRRIVAAARRLGDFPETVRPVPGSAGTHGASSSAAI